MALERIIRNLVGAVVRAGIPAAAGKEWLVPDLMAAAGEGVVDRLKEGTSNRVLQELQRALKPSLKALFRDVQGEEGAFDAATFALEQTLAAENLSVGRSIDGSLNRVTLAAEFVRESKRHTQELSERTRSAVERMMTDLAGKICPACRSWMTLTRSTGGAPDGGWVRCSPRLVESQRCSRRRS